MQVWPRSRWFRDKVDRKTFWCNLGHVNAKLFLARKCKYASIYTQRLFFSMTKEADRVKISYVLTTLNNVVSLLQSKAKKTANFSAGFFCVMRDSESLLMGAHRSAWIASPGDLIDWNYKKVPSSAAKQRTMFIHSAGMRWICVCIHLSLCCNLRLLS